MPVYALDDQVPAIDPEAFVHPDAVIIGNVELGAGMDHQIKRKQYDVPLFEANMRKYRPRTIAFTSKRAASLFLRASSTRGIAFGRRAKLPADFPEVFVLPSPSGAARGHWSVTPWRELARWLKAA